MIKAEWTNKDSLDLQPTCNQLATTEGELISREGAIECIRWGESVTDVIDRINALPSAEPKTGHWILSQDDVYEYCTCSNCGYMNGENWMNGSDIPFCANCGADMRGDKHE